MLRQSYVTEQVVVTYNPGEGPRAFYNAESEPVRVQQVHRTTEVEPNGDASVEYRVILDQIGEDGTRLHPWDRLLSSVRDELDAHLLEG